MRIALVGGIYGMPPEFRERNLQSTTETQLEAGLKALGHDVITERHRLWNNLNSVDVMHVHHLATSCVQLPLRRVPVVFTRHATKPLPAHHATVLASSYRRANAIVALSEAEKELFVPGKYRDKTSVIYNGIDSTVFYPPQPSTRRGKEVRLLYVGQLIDLKRVNLAIELLRRASGVGIDAALTIITHRPTLEPELRRQAEELGVARRVNWSAALGQVQVAAAMRQADALVLPSRTEALSTVISEAVLSGLPPITFNVGGAQEQLPSGWPLRDPRDVSGWLEDGVRMLSNIEEYREDIIRFHGTARTRFSVENMVQRHAELYERAAA